MKAKRSVVSLLLVLAITSFQAMAGAATPSTILVVPARARMVQLAFQIAAVKDAGILSYGNAAGSPEILLHVWNGQEWIRITADEYAAGAFMAGTASDVFILGPANETPAFMNADPLWGKTVHRITTLETAAILNEMGKSVKFTPRQWKWLAEKNNLTLTDTNAERRRYGRWGRSGIDSAVRPRATAPAESVVMPPAASAAQEPLPAPVVPVALPPAAPAAKPQDAPALEPAPIAPAVKPPMDPTTK